MHTSSVYSGKSLRRVVVKIGKMEGAQLKQRAISEIEKHVEELNKLGEEVWKNPELAYEEYKAHDLLTDYLERKGFDVTRSYLGVKTAFKATFGSDDKPNICVISEYDALPEIGHACGHSLIAESGIAAGLGIKAAMKANGAPLGRLTVMGTPAEEGGSGKVKLIEKGAFDDVDLAMMVHPYCCNILRPNFLANCYIKITYHGKAAHAAAFPWEGINALDAAVLAYTNISVLRQQLKSTIRIHGIITNGGDRPNIIPEQSEMRYSIRAQTRQEVTEIKPKVIACFEAAAKATGCTVEVTETTRGYNEMHHNATMVDLYEANAKQLGLTHVEYTTPTGSTDMGNVSYVVPAIHPMYGIGDGTQVNHTREFTAAANTPEAYQNTLTAAKAIAMAVIDLYATPELVKKAKEAFNKQS